MLGLAISACSSSPSSTTAGSGATSNTGSGSSTSAPFSTLSSGVLTVGVVGSEPPGYITNAAGTQISGVVGDIINGFAAKYHLTVKVTVLSDFGSFVLAIEQDKVDIGAALAYSTVRGKLIDYSVGWLDAPLMAITRAGFSYNGPSSVNPSRVGTGIGVAWAAELQKWNSNTKLFSSATVEEQALLSGEIDVALINGDAVLGAPFTSKNAAAHTVNPGDFGIDASLIQSSEYSATACKNGSLMTAYSNYIASLDNSGALAALYTKYHAPAGSEPTTLKAPASCS
jgi:hypothetical protein